MTKTIPANTIKITWERYDTPALQLEVTLNRHAEPADVMERLRSIAEQNASSAWVDGVQVRKVRKLNADQLDVLLQFMEQEAESSKIADLMDGYISDVGPRYAQTFAKEMIKEQDAETKAEAEADPFENGRS